MSYLFPLTEIGVFLLFLICLIHAIKYDKKSIYLLFSALIYALIFENGNIILSKGNIGSYYYNSQFSLFIYHVPLFVVLSWSVIIYTSKYFSDSLPLKQFSRPFIASLLVLLIDLAIDTVAIRLKFWTWVGYVFNEGFFGVPANNFIGWLLVSFTFYFFIYNIPKYKIFAKENLLKYTSSITIGYLIFIILFSLINSIESTLKLSKLEEFYILFTLIVLFLVTIRINRANKIKKETRFLMYIVRSSFYLFELIGIILAKIYLENFLLLIFSIFFIFIELILVRFERLRK